MLNVRHDPTQPAMHFLGNLSLFLSPGLGTNGASPLCARVCAPISLLLFLLPLGVRGVSSPPAPMGPPMFGAFGSREQFSLLFASLQAFPVHAKSVEERVCV